ncbi:MAG: ATP-binding cassette domain-containing protein [Methanomicrobiaceae archaeon]|nr:ATP-binding cassette domain-containing protein [Methanomicrobiaceae archaeon]
MNIESPPLLSVSNLGVSFSGKTLFSGLSFNIDEGELVVLTGPSGSGKSTLLKCLNRLVAPGSGSIMLRGADISSCDPAVVRRYITYVGQIPAMFPGTVAENLSYPFSFKANRGLGMPDFGEILREVGLSSDYCVKNASRLSGGEQQRVAIARALALSPRILLLDEPTASLDEKVKIVLEELIVRLNRDLSMTIIVVTHDMEQAGRLSGRILNIGDEGPGEGQ